MSKLLYESNIIEFVNRDCELRGHGRKKWWAENLGVSSMTLSHWIVGRRHPSTKHLENLFVLSESIIADQERTKLADSLWKSYYDKRVIQPEILKVVVENLLRSSCLQPRLLALLVYLFEKTTPSPYSEPPIMHPLRNRLGWLYESAGLDGGFKPADTETIRLLELSDTVTGDQKIIKKYLSTDQTELGKKWRVYDCSLGKLKANLDWKFRLRLS